MTYPYPPTYGSPTAWGEVQGFRTEGPGGYVVRTAGHGGVCVAPWALRQVPAALRRQGDPARGWFEEDSDWAIAYLALGLHRYGPPDHDNAQLREAAIGIVRRRFPDQLQAALRAGELVPEGGS